jgi:hypothetical protein
MNPAPKTIATLITSLDEAIDDDQYDRIVKQITAKPGLAAAVIDELDAQRHHYEQLAGKRLKAVRVARERARQAEAKHARREKGR